jgi:uncharacterized surface protein with fasciclin (FAS1) repeats
MKRTLLIALAIFTATFAFSQKKDVVDVAMGSKNHTTLVKAIKGAELVTALKGEGPFTVFAPTNDAFAALPEGTLEELLMPENKETLQAILKYHVIQGQLNADRVMATIKRNDGKVMLKTLQGAELEAYIEDGKVFLKDAKGQAAQVTATDLYGKNGVIHVIDTVLLPE